MDIFALTSRWVVRRTESRRVRSEFLGRYVHGCFPAVWARASEALNLAAIAFAAGAIGGMYLQAVAFEYQVVWHSTLVHDPEMRLLIARALFFPAAFLLGGSFPDAGMIQAMASTEGAPGAIWIHVYAISGVALIVIPRFAMAILDGRRARRYAEAVGVDIDDDYWRCFGPAAERRVDAKSTDAAGDGAHARTETISDHWWKRADQITDVFQLDGAGASILASAQGCMIEEDIKRTSASGVWSALRRKREWYDAWRKVVQTGIDALHGNRIRPIPMNGGWEEAASQLAQSSNRYARELVLLELAAFEAYWPLETQTVSKRRWGITAISTPTIAKDARRKVLEQASVGFGLPPEFAKGLRSEMASTSRDLSDFWKTAAIGATAGVVIGTFTMGIAAPFIGAAIGQAMGLAGAAAANAGLAALGGGAIAAGGLGIAGGSAVLMGGGALVGLGLGGVGAQISSATVLISAVKAEIFLRRIVWEKYRDESTFSEVIGRIQAAFERMHEELGSHKINSDLPVSELKNLERIVGILQKWLDRNRTWMEWARKQPTGQRRSSNLFEGVWSTFRRERR